jgi:hypothetical protein
MTTTSCSAQAGAHKIVCASLNDAEHRRYPRADQAADRRPMVERVRVDIRKRDDRGAGGTNPSKERRAHGESARADTRPRHDPDLMATRHHDGMSGE